MVSPRSCTLCFSSFEDLVPPSLPISPDSAKTTTRRKGWDDGVASCHPEAGPLRSCEERAVLCEGSWKAPPTPVIGSSHHLANSTQPIGPSLKMFLSSERITFTRHSLCNCQMNADAVRHHMETQGRPSAPAALAQPRRPPPRPAPLQNPHEGPAQWARGWRARRRAARWGRVGSSVGVRTWDMRRPRGAPWIALRCGKAAHLCSEGTTESTQAPYVPTVW